MSIRSHRLLLPALAAALLAGVAGAQPMPHERGGPMDRGPMAGPMDRGPMDRGPMGGRPGPGNARSARDYVMQAGAGDLFERTSSETVLATTRDREVRRFARMMIADHSASARKLKTAAMRSDLRVPPPMLNPDQRRMIDDLRRARGRDRDRVYLDQQRMAHDAALALHRDYARSGDAPALRRAADEIVPVVRSHIDMLRSMRR